MWTYNYTDELYHHGILGMKWGVRRYKNADGTLTNDGKKKYDKMSPDKLNKILKKEVHKAQNKNGRIIGKNSKQAIKSFDKYLIESDKKFLKEKDDKKRKKIMQEYLDSGAVKIEGKRYSEKAIKNIGKINIAYLKDLGYDDKTSLYLNKKLSKSKRVSIY